MESKKFSPHFLFLFDVPLSKSQGKSTESPLHLALCTQRLENPSRLRLVLCPMDACHEEPHTSSGLPVSKKLSLLSMGAALNPQTVEQP